MEWTIHVSKLQYRTQLHIARLYQKCSISTHLKDFEALIQFVCFKLKVQKHTICAMTSPSFDDFFHVPTSKCLKTFTYGCCHTEKKRRLITGQHLREHNASVIHANTVKISNMSLDL